MKVGGKKTLKGTKKAVGLSVVFNLSNAGDLLQWKSHLTCQVCDDPRKLGWKRQT